jgi:predicted esterase
VLSVAEAEDFIGNLQDALADAARENDAHNIADRELEVARKWWRLGK